MCHDSIWLQAERASPHYELHQQDAPRHKYMSHHFPCFGFLPSCRSACLSELKWHVMHKICQVITSKSLCCTICCIKKSWCVGLPVVRIPVLQTVATSSTREVQSSSPCSTKGNDPLPQNDLEWTFPRCKSPTLHTYHGGLVSSC